MTAKILSDRGDCAPAHHFHSSRLQAEVGLSRQRMVVMALLLGCDYNLGGVAGVGREAVSKLFSVWGKPQ